MTDKKRVLIVEDESTSRRILAKILGDDVQCHFAVNGAEALDEVQAALDAERPYDLICLDLMLPDKSGFDVLVEIRQAETENKGLADAQPVVVCTALDDVAFVRKAFRQQCSGYIVKPFEKAKVLDTMAKMRLLDR